MRKVRKVLVVGLISVLAMAGSAAQSDDPNSNSKSPAEILAEVEALKENDVAWREIQWKKCLLEGLKESSAQHKPVMLWVFIDRPFDDERC